MKKRKQREAGGPSKLSQSMAHILKSSEWSYDEKGLKFLSDDDDASAS